MYSITNEDIKEAINECKSAMTVKGQIIGYSFTNCGKNIENRNRKIKNGWYALHLGSSKKTNPKLQFLETLIGDYKKEDLPPTSSILGCFKIEGQTNDYNNKWFIGPVGNVLAKFIVFKKPIRNIPGHQSITYKLETIDNKLKKKGYEGEDIKTLIKKSLEECLS
jgi:hypothetical protein